MSQRNLEIKKSLGLLCVISAMGCGGAERRLAWMVNRLSALGHRVALRVLHSGDSHFDIDARVDARFFADDHHKVFTPPMRFWKRCRWLRRQIVEWNPDVVLSFIDVANVMTLLSTMRLEVPVVVAERGYPPLSRIPWYYRKLRNRVYRYADVIVVQTDEAASSVRKMARHRPVVVIPNPVPPAQGLGAKNVAVKLPRGPKIAAMGRLVYEKGFDLLVEAFSEIADRHPEWTVVIFGEGPERDRLERLIAERTLSGRVLLVGQVSDTDAALTMCDLFVMPSRHEGFPNALCEAMACGLPAVSFDCPAGPRNIIRAEVDGILVPLGNVTALASQVSRLISDGELRRALAQRAVEVVSRFDAGTILTSWEDILEGTVESYRTGAG